MSITQCSGASISYNFKYCLNGLFAIDDTKDADNGPSEKELEAKKEFPAKSAKVGKVPSFSKKENKETNEPPKGDFF
jgi:hypothetical protein